MKNYYRLIVFLALLFLLGIGFMFYITREGNGKEFNKEAVSLDLNDITKRASDNWGDFGSFDDLKYSIDYIILDNNNRVMYDSQHQMVVNDISEKLNVAEAINSKQSYMYVLKDDQIVGSVIRTDDGNEWYRRLRIRFLLGAFIFCCIFLAGAVLYGRYINKNIIVPFDNMKDFASSVAMGNLNEPLLMDKENMFGSFTESFDIMREELSQSKKREIELQRREKELIASLSHDLKTPITGIKLTSELLKAKISKNSDGQEDDTIQKLDNIYNKADQIDVLVNDLFAAALDDLGEFKVNTQDEESKILKDIVVKYDDKELVSQSDIPDVVINIDQNRMSQVIGNIISNSYKYAGTKIDIKYEVIDDYLEMCIADYGPGVPEDEISLITNKFYRGKQWAKGEKDGNGLGLYISRILMEKMNGELLPENSSDGFIVRLLIPLS